MLETLASADAAVTRYRQRIYKHMLALQEPQRNQEPPRKLQPSHVIIAFDTRTGKPQHKRHRYEAIADNDNKAADVKIVVESKDKKPTPTKTTNAGDAEMAVSRRNRTIYTTDVTKDYTCRATRSLQRSTRSDRVTLTAQSGKSPGNSWVRFLPWKTLVSHKGYESQ